MLPLDRVRQLAQYERYQEIYFNEDSRVISFQRDVVRINIYYTTGTVGTCVDHPRQGKTQLFRRDVDLSLLMTILNNPRVHTDRGYQQRDRKRDHDSITTSVRDEESESLAYLADLQVEREALDRQIADVQAFVDVYEKRRAEQAEEQRRKAEEDEKRRAEQAEEQRRKVEEDRKVRERDARGSKHDYYLMKECQEMMDNGFDSDCTVVALSGDRDVGILLTESDWYYTSGLPTRLYQLLHTRSKGHPRPDYVSLGSNGCFYVHFANGKSEWSGPDSLSEKLHKESRDVKSLAFGADYDTWFIVWEDGGFNWDGSIPSGLEDLLGKGGRRGDLAFVSLGPSGEFFVMAKNGKAWWKGPIDEGQFSKNVNKYRGRVQRVHFGYDGTYVIRYS